MWSHPLHKMHTLYPARIYDFANLKNPPADDLHTNNIHPLKQITATKLFDQDEFKDAKIKKLFTQPNLSNHNETCLNIFNNGYSTGSTFLSHRHSTIYDSQRPWLDLVKKADKCTECWNEAWQKIINDLDESGKIDRKTLEALYLLRNAHQHGFFQFFSDESESNGQSSGDESSKYILPSSNGNMYNNINGHSDIDPSYKTANPIYVSSSSLDESLASDRTNSPMEYLHGRPMSSSSGRSTPSFRKKPKRPDIRLSGYKDYVEIHRTDSLTSLDSEMDRYSYVSDGSFVEIPFLSETINYPNRYCDTLHEIEETLRGDENTSFSLNYFDVKYNNLKQICIERPESPTSLLLLPLFMSDSDDPMTALHTRLSPLLHKLKTLEEESELVSSLKEQLAALEKEKQQILPIMNHEQTSDDDSTPFNSDITPFNSDMEEFTTKVNNYTIQKDIIEETIVANQESEQLLSENPFSLSTEIGTQYSPDVKDVGCQKYLELYAHISHKSTSTTPVKVNSIGVGDNVADLLKCDAFSQCFQEYNDFSCQNDILLSDRDKSTETIKVDFANKAIGDGIAELTFKSLGIQESPIQMSTSTQSEETLFCHVGTMVGAPTSSLTDFGIGDNMADIIYNNYGTQTNLIKNINQSTQSDIESSDKSVSCGCSSNNLVSSYTQHVSQTNDFLCGDGIAEVQTVDKSVSNVPILSDSNVGTDRIKTADSSVTCNIKNKTVSEGVGDDTIFDFCEKCTVAKRDVEVGMYINMNLCTVDDKLCDCIKPSTRCIGVGDYSVKKINCDKCENLKVSSVAVGDCKIDDLLCDDCFDKNNKHINGQNNMVSIGIGDQDVNDIKCEKCNSKDENDNIFNFDLNILNNPQPSHQHPVLCHYCGNKVDLNDTQLDESLQSMRDNMKSISCGMKRTTASKNLNVEYDHTDHLNSVSDDDVNATISDDEYEEDTTSGRNDVIEACKMLHEHFSGQKPLKQPSMMKYVGIIQALWFKTVKRRRANASVVKSYIDLFQQRIPELMETIVNLCDDEGNTALHYALTYKNLGVASILLDSGECCVDLVNQAGYSPIMLAALAGFEKKNDKYIMQRLFRLGNINKESAETGQTPLMLAVSRGNIGVVELLSESGCDINATDDEGSTALMGACEHGNINIVKSLLGHPDCDATIEDNEGSTALSIAMDARRKDLALLIYGSLNFDARGRIKLSPSKQSLLGLGRRSPSPVIGRR